MLKVCPIQGRQLKDVREEDIFGDFRICNTYRGGGGYDQFPEIAKKRGLVTEQIKGDVGNQFVVQLQGCHLRCPYCYVTRDGIYGKTVEYDVPQVMEEFFRAAKEKGTGTFHMMGGAPFLQVEEWETVPMDLYPNYLFTSDLLLTERVYDYNTLCNIATPNSLYAINIKGINSVDYKKNTGRNIDWLLFWNNFDKVVKSGLNFYVTFTNPDPYGLYTFKSAIMDSYGIKAMFDNFVINLKQYEAIKGGEAW